MQIIDYFACNDKTHWRTAIADNEWRAAKHLARLLEQGNFHDEVGKGTVYLLTEGDKLVSFLTLAERDCVDVPYGPWIGFVHTAPEDRATAMLASSSTMPALLPESTAQRGSSSVPTMWACTRSTASPTWRII